MSWGFRFWMFFSGYEVDFDAFKDFDLNEENDCKTCKHRRCRHCKHINTFRTVILITVLTYLASLVAAFFLTPFMEAKKGIGDNSAHPAVRFDFCGVRCTDLGG